MASRQPARVHSRAQHVIPGPAQSGSPSVALALVTATAADMTDAAGGAAGLGASWERASRAGQPSQALTDTGTSDTARGAGHPPALPALREQMQRLGNPARPDLQAPALTRGLAAGAEAEAGEGSALATPAAGPPLDSAGNAQCAM
jgi:hypothetical protein